MLKPYHLSKEDLIEIEKYSYEWRHTELSNIAKSIGDYLRFDHGERCFYCKIKLNRQDGHVEHILSKGNTNYKEFAYHPYNLILSCKDCNGPAGKSTEDVLVVSSSYHPKMPFKYHQYPNNSSYFSIVHPYFDEYEEFIEIEDYIFYKALHQKGLKTIEVCNLHRLKLAMDNINQAREDFESTPVFTRIANSNDPQYVEKVKKMLIYSLEDNTDLFDSILAINKNENQLDLVNRLESKYYSRIDILNDKNIDLIKKILKETTELKRYNKLVDRISRINTIHPISTLSYSKKDLNKTLLSFTGLKDIYQKINCGSVRVSDVSRKAIKQLLDQPSKLEYPSIISWLESKHDRENNLKVLKFFIELLSDEAIYKPSKGMKAYAFDLINRELHHLGDQVEKNPQLEILHKVEYICKKVLHTFELKELKKAKKTIEKFLGWTDLV
ncbi:HNH endonuclease [Priestia aryabhattai]|uniref:HNH endonuclease n=1 Tax=Priestia aryabhattai TaxID=412384 RepID=UPI003B672990